MVINIYYGGRGLVDDPTLTVLEKMQLVLEELRVKVNRYNLYEFKNTIPTLPQTLKEADGVILASTVEWYGIGGNMLQFLDACWQFGDKERIADIYMMPVVMSRTYGEREAQMDLIKAWELLGGKLCSGITGFIENTIELEMNARYVEIIEKSAESLYRNINQKRTCLPSSNRAVNQKIAVGTGSILSPQESEQLSEYVSDENYVQTQKEDIQELTNLFKSKMESEVSANEEEYLGKLRTAFKPKPDLPEAVFALHFEEKKKPLVLKIKGTSFGCEYGEAPQADVIVKLNRKVMNSIVGGSETFQHAFMSGNLTMKGDFQKYQVLDQVLKFS